MLHKFGLVELSAAGAVVWTCLHHLLHQSLQLGVEVTDAPLKVKSGCNHTLEQLTHVGGFEGRTVTHHLIEHTSLRPNVALEVVWLVFPDFGACVERSASLRVKHAFLYYFRDVEVSEFDLTFGVQEHISTLDVSVADVGIVQRLQPHDGLRGNADSFSISEACSVFDMISNSLGQISVISILHDKAESLTGLINEAFLVLNDVWMFDACHESNLVQRIKFLAGTESLHLDL